MEVLRENSSIVMRKAIYLLLVSVFSFTFLQAQSGDQAALDALKANSGQNGYLTSDFADVFIANDYTSQGIRHIYYLQAIGGMSIYGSTASAHLKDGQVFKINNQFIPNLAAMQVIGNPSISAKTAIERLCAIKGMDLESASLQVISEDLNEVHRTTVLSESNIALSEIKAKLMYLKANDTTLKVAWSIGIDLKGGESSWMNYFIDANTGELINEVSWTVEHNHEGHTHNEASDHEPTKAEVAKSNAVVMPSTAQYNVLPVPVESPNYGPRSIVINPADPTASPYGWHDTNGADGAEFTDTRGNNVDAYADLSNSSTPGVPRPAGGPTLNFDFPIDFSMEPLAYVDASVTNLFYWNNITHDILYKYGFDEASGNFQVNNYGKGGAGGDDVRAEAQDGGGNCNANMGTPADGGRPRMQMYLCNRATPRRDGSLDNFVIVHEYVHGLTNRLTGGPAAAGCLRNSEQMGEGWSDWYALMLTMTPTDMSTDARGGATYLFGQPANGPGIREYPYSTDLTVDPRTYDHIKGTGTSPHRLGSVWAAMLWEVTWALVDSYGFDEDFIDGNGGNNIALQLVTEALKLQPCSPGFVDGRDAILAADQALYDGLHHCLIWNAFAKRGLGFSADQGSSFDRTDGTEAFDLPVGIPNMCPSPIPTMPQWMLFIFGLLMVTVSVVYIGKKAELSKA